MENNLPDMVNPKWSQIMGMAGPYDVRGSTYYGPEVDTYGIMIDNKVAAFLAIKTKSKNLAGIECYQVEKIWVAEEFRKKGLAYSLVEFVTSTIKNNLQLGPRLTVAGKEFTKALIKSNKFEIKIYNEKTDLLLDEEPENLMQFPNSYDVLILAPNQRFNEADLYINKLRPMSRFVKQDGSSEYD
jgi:hypothetical protein